MKYLIEIPYILGILENIKKYPIPTPLHLENISWNQMVICICLLKKMISRMFLISIAIIFREIILSQQLQIMKKLISRNFCAKIVNV